MQVVEIPLESEVNILNDKIRFIMVHPSLEEKIADTGDGFRFINHSRASQIKLIENTFPLVRYHPSSGDTHADFIVFPELSVPEEGLQIIEDAMCNDWPINSVVTGGLEYIKGERFKNLLDNSDNPNETRKLPNNVASFNINTAFIYIKTKNKKVKKYYQSKMSGSLPEQELQNQLRGNYLLLFNTNSLVFTQVVCFDAIARSIANNIIAEIKKIEKLLRIDLLFIIQNNDSPNKEDFIDSAKKLLEEGGRELIIDSVIFANSNNMKYGCSSRYGKNRFHFKRGNYQDFKESSYPIPATFFILEKNLIKCAQFREDGPCIHTFIYYPPWTGGASLGDYRLPFDKAFMHKISDDDSIGDGKPIDGLWKNVFDFLPDDLPANDTKNRWTTDHCNQMNIKLKQNFKEIRQELIMDGVPKNRLKEITDLLFLGYGENKSRKRINNPDFWENNYEGEGIIDLVSGLTIFEILGNVVLQDSCLSKSHTALFSDNEKEFYLTFMDNPNDELNQHRLKEKYHKFLNENVSIQWGEVDWTKNTLMLICTGNSTPSDDSIEKYKKYFSTSDSEEKNIFPADLILNTKGLFTSLKNYGWLYTYSMDKLRGDLERNCSEIIPQWRRKLEPLRS